MGEGLHKCVVCRGLTSATPLLILRPRLYVELNAYVKPAHRAIGQALKAFFITGRWVWSL